MIISQFGHGVNAYPQPDWPARAFFPGSSSGVVLLLITA
jgi:hypothetical protein